MKIQLFSAALLFSCCLLSCDSEKRISRDVFEKVQQANEVKKLKEVDIFNEAMKWGEEISVQAQEQLMGTLQRTIKEKGISEAVEFCNIKALPILKEVGDNHGVVIRRTSKDYRNPLDQPDENEKLLLEAYAYNQEHGIKNESNIQPIEEGTVLLFSKAITIPGTLCLNCHGEPGKDINQETLLKINRLYPDDKATGHKIGELRGMWSITIPKKAVVNRL